ncbi:MAG: FAD:protein FMN transferase [Verrucomicrobia bacterium]|nr:FAD:protein FMN transferase [Verrucomicrobiota bacterium]
MAFLRFARHAMATRFELVLPGADEVRLRAIAEEALDEIERLENLLSRYRPHTDIARINRGAAFAPVPISPETFRLLERARKLTEFTEGAFDPTVGALLEVWGFTSGAGRTPEPDLLEAARTRIGWNQVELDDSHSTVRFLQPGVSLDLGAIGKGYALDVAVERLREAGVKSALIHGGTSSMVAIGPRPDGSPWFVSVVNSPESSQTIPLQNESLSVSAPTGKWFRDEAGLLQGHVLDPVLGKPVAVSHPAAVVSPFATDSDALSTALLVRGPQFTGKLAEWPKTRGWLEAPGNAVAERSEATAWRPGG